MLPLLGPLCALVAGILASPYLDPHAVWICLPLAILLAFARPWGLLLTFFLLGSGVRSLEPAVPPDPGDVAVRLIGKLAKAPEWRGLGVYLDVELQTVDAQPYRGHARLTEFLEDSDLKGMFDALDLGSGDRVEILVKLHRPSVYRDPGVFNFRRYLERQKIYWTGTIRSPRLIRVISRGFRGLRGLDLVRRWVYQRVARPFDGDTEMQGLIMGMDLGRKYGLSPHIERAFQAGGLYHLVVVSGFNLAIVAGLTFWVVRRLPLGRRTRLIVVLLTAMTYASLVEGGAPVERAVWMVGFVVIGKLLDRGHAAGNAIAGTAIVLLLKDPTSLEDSGFLMTFAAVLAVVGMGMPAVKWGLGWLDEALRDFNDADRDGRLPVRAADWRVTRRLWCELYGLPTWVVTLPWRVGLALAEIAVISLTVEMAFLVFMVESFHRLSPISPLLNVPAGIVATVVTPLGLATIFMPAPLAHLAGLVATGLLRGLLVVVDWGLRIPGATMRAPSVPLWLWGLYGLSVLGLAWSIRERRLGVFVGGVVAVVSLQTVVARADFSPAPPKQVTLTFLDVGQGDSTFIEFPDGKRMLIDGGGVAAGRFLDLRDESTFSIGENVVSPYLFSRRIRRIDTLVLTHAHIDHLEGLLAVIENFEVGELWLGRNPMNAAYRELIRRALEKQIPIRWLTKGMVVPPFTVLHPPANWKPRKGGENDDSLVLLLDTGKETALLTGDIERAIPAPAWVDVLKVPHHGSKGVKLSVRSRIRVISVGANNPFGHPDASTLPAWRTDQLGAITVMLKGEN